MRKKLHFLSRSVGKIGNPREISSLPGFAWHANCSNQGQQTPVVRTPRTPLAKGSWAGQKAL